MLKTLHQSQSRQATWLELFFDLVFVAVIGAVTHALEINYIPPPLSVEGLEGLEVYPNPVHDFLYLDIQHLPSNTRIYLHSMDGKLVAQPKFSEVIANSRISGSQERVPQCSRCIERDNSIARPRGEEAHFRTRAESRPMNV